MKKVITIIIAVVMVFALSATAFAAASDRAKEVTGDNNGKALGIEKQERNNERLRELFAKYFSEGLEKLDEIQEDHREFHEEAKEDREELQEAIRADFDEIKSAVESGDLTRREGHIQIINLRMDIRSMRNEMDEVILEKIDAQAPVHDRLAEIREEIKGLLSTDPIDADAIAVLLEESLGLFETHLENDIYYHGLCQDIAESYGY